MKLTRRHALAACASLAASRTAAAQQIAGEPAGRIPPVDELVSTAEFRDVAARKLDSLTFAAIDGSERAAFDRITLRPRLMIDSRKLDLTTELFGQRLFTPILVGPVANLKRYHPEGELAMARGSAAAKAILVVAEDASHPIEEIAEQAKGQLWYQVYLDRDPSESRAQIERATRGGCKAICVTLGDGKPGGGSARAGIDWSALERLRKGVGAPILLKGVMSPEEARKAVAAGLQGVVVSSYTPQPIPGLAAPIEVLPSIVDAIAGKAAVLMDGSVRRGSDVLKALALGANAALVARPAVWGLAAYGATGVQGVVEMLQSEFARDMAMCGKVTVKALDRTVVRVHRR